MAEQGPGRPVSGGTKGRQKEEAEEESGGERDAAGKEEYITDRPANCTVAVQMAASSTNEESVGSVGQL